MHDSRTPRAVHHAPLLQAHVLRRAQFPLDFVWAGTNALTLLAPLRDYGRKGLHLVRGGREEEAEEAEEEEAGAVAKGAGKSKAARLRQPRG